MTRTVLRLAACVLCCLLAAPAMAQTPACDVPPVAALPFVLVNSKVLVIVQANGQNAFFAIDTGGFASAVSESLAARLKLKTFPIRTYQNLRDFGEERAEKYALLDSLQIGSLKAGADRYMVADLGPGIDGLIAPDYLRNFDLDFDFAANRLTLYRPGACPGHPPGTDNFAAVEMDVTEQGHIRIPVTLDGKQVWAVVDTGAQRTYMTAAAARSTFDLRMGETRGVVRGASDGTLAVAPHDFATLQIGSFIQNAPTIGLIDRSQSFENSAPILLGMAQLKGFRLYVSYRERLMYVSRPPSRGPGAASGGPAPEGALGPAEAIVRAAADQVQPATFSFVVRGTGEGDGKRFLNSEKDYHDPANVTVDLPLDLMPALQARFGADLTGQRIIVTGVARRVLIRTRQANGDAGSYYQTHIALDGIDKFAVAP